MEPDVQTNEGTSTNFTQTTPITKLDTFSKDDLKYEYFFDKHMMKNIPCIITNVTNQWGGLNWVVDDKPNFQHLIDSYGNASVPVANCNTKYYNAQKKEDQCLKEYLEYWKDYIKRNYPDDAPCLYLKDWHFTKDFPDEKIYKVPHVFAPDWLNEYFSERDDIKDDYRFVYMGPKGSWTPLHADVFSSFSWSVNLCGKKRWVLYPPGEETCLMDKHGNLVHDIESPSLQDSNLFVDYNKLKTVYDIIQNAGEAIFVPSGWHHQVWNLDDTISINHNWANGCNIGKIWAALKDNLKKVKLEIADCETMDGWEEHCQTMLNSVYGINYEHFAEFLRRIVHLRILYLSRYNPFPTYRDPLYDVHYLQFDLMQAMKTLQELMDDNDTKKLDYFKRASWSILTTIQEADITLGIEIMY